MPHQSGDQGLAEGRPDSSMSALVVHQAYGPVIPVQHLPSIVICKPIDEVVRLLGDLEVKLWVGHLWY